MVRGLPPATALRGRAAAAVRWCTCRRVAVAVCLGNLVAALLVARALYAPGTFTSSPRRGEVKCSKEQMRWVEESIRIRRAAEPVELIEAVKKLRKAFEREAKRRKELPLELKQKVSHEILQRLRDLGENRNTTQQRVLRLECRAALVRHHLFFISTNIKSNLPEAIESWRVEMLKSIRSSSTHNLSNFSLTSEESIPVIQNLGILKRALEFNWRMLLEDIGLWIPPTVYHIEHDDKLENELEGSTVHDSNLVDNVLWKDNLTVTKLCEEEIIPGPPLPPECNAELHTDYGGTAVRWGLTHHKESAADCCQACIDQAKRAKPGALRCNIWVYCPSEYGCYSPDKYEHKHQECWLKQADHPKLNFKDRYSEPYRDSHPTAPVVVPWMSGVISP
nr:unnamed protein product [Digitaria exilis]